MRRPAEYDVDELEEEKISFPKTGQTQQSDSYRQILSSNQINSYLNNDTQMHMENYNEQINLIQKAIIQEENCPDLLPFEENLYNNICDILSFQEKALEDVEKSLDKKTYLHIYALEIERIKYLLKSYLRVRLFKIQKLYLYIIKNKLSKLLSAAEIKFLKQQSKLYEIKESHFKENVTNHLPKHLRNLGLMERREETYEDNMGKWIHLIKPLVPEPDIDRVVTVRVLRKYEKYALNVEQGQFSMIFFNKFLEKKLISFQGMYYVQDLEMSSKIQNSLSNFIGLSTKMDILS